MIIIGKAFALAEFQSYVDRLELGTWQPSLVVIHHTAAPSLAMRPVGWQPQHMANLKYHYEHNVKGAPWSAGPHIFTDEEKVWIFSPLEKRGVHAVSFNALGWGIEMLGDYDAEDPWSGRGLNVMTLTAHATAILLQKIGRDAAAIRFHRDDPKTTKSCPGRKVNKARFIALVAAAL